MKRLTAITLVLVLTLTAAGTAVAADKLEISGDFTSDLIGDTEQGTMSDTETFNLMLERKFGFDADLYLDLEFGSYTQNQAVVPTGDGQVELRELPEAQRKTDVNFAEAYVNYYTKNMDWRLGKQEINWGSSYKLQPTNYFNPRDLTALKPLDEKKGVKAVKGVYYAPARIEVSGVVTPFFATHEMSQQDKLNSLNQLSEKTKQQAAGNIYGELDDRGFIDKQISSSLTINADLNSDKIDSILAANQTVKKVKDEAENAQGGIKFTKRSFKGFDLSASIYHGRDKMPLIDKEKTEEKVKSLLKDYGTHMKTTPEDFIDWYQNTADNKQIPVDILYPETNRIGLDAIGDIGDMGVWTEVAYSMYEDDQFDDRVKAAVGVDYKFDNDLYLVGQTYYQQGRIDSESDVKAVNLHFDKPVFDFHEIKMNAIYEVESETYMVEPQFDYSLANSTVLQLGGTYLESDDEEGSSLISSLGDDRVYARLKIEF